TFVIFHSSSKSVEPCCSINSTSIRKNAASSRSSGPNPVPFSSVNSGTFSLLNNTSSSSRGRFCALMRICALATVMAHADTGNIGAADMMDNIPSSKKTRTVSGQLRVHSKYITVTACSVWLPGPRARKSFSRDPRRTGLHNATTRWQTEGIPTRKYRYVMTAFVKLTLKTLSCSSMWGSVNPAITSM
ncbi:hypothetical protein DFH06DRAFT_1227065, partial [Mycena polygramma]